VRQNAEAQRHFTRALKGLEQRLARKNATKPAKPAKEPRPSRPELPSLFYQTGSISIVDGKTITKVPDYPAAYWLKMGRYRRPAEYRRQLAFKDNVMPEEYAYAFTHDGKTYGPAACVLITYSAGEFFRPARSRHQQLSPARRRTRRLLAARMKLETRANFPPFSRVFSNSPSRHLPCVRPLFILASVAAFALPPAPPAKLDAAGIIQRSVEAGNRDFKMAPLFNYKQRERTGGVIRTSQVTMIDGSPYQRLLAVNGKPLDIQQAAQEEKKQQAAVQARKNESPSARKSRIAKYERDRTRDQFMMSQLSTAFNFTLMGQRKLRGYSVWALKAVPRPGYQPPNMEAQVLPGMQGEMWIDTKTYQWVKVTARVIRPVSIEGFLAQVEPGTEFEVEKSPVQPGIWQITHFSSVAQARVLHMFNHNEQDEITFFDFQPAK
jgi:hypothetical protein